MQLSCSWNPGSIAAGPFALCQRDHIVHQRSGGFGLGYRCGNAFLNNYAGYQTAKQCLAGTGVPLEFVSGNLVFHFFLP